MINASTKALRTSFTHTFRPINKDMILSLLPLDRKLIIPAIKLLTNTFLQKEPTCHFFKPSENALFSLFEEAVHRSMDENMSIMCLDLGTKNLVGAWIGFDVYNFMQKPLWNNIRDPGLDEVIELLEAAEKDVSLVPSKPYEIVSSFCMAVDLSYAKNGIAKELLRFAIKEHPIVLKAEYVTSTTTSPITQKITEELGFKIIKRVVFDEYKNSKGEQPLKSLDKFAEDNMGFKNFKHIEYSAYKV